MAPTNAVELATPDFGRWARQLGLALPVPLNSGHAARVELDRDELAALDEPRLRVTNALETSEPGRSPALREMLRYAHAVLGAPSTGLYAVRSELTGENETMAIGLSVGAEGLLVVDSARTTRLVRLPATDLATAVAGALPPTRGFPMQRFELSDRALAMLYGTGTAAPSARATRIAAQASGLPTEWLENLVRIQQTATAGGLIGAVRYQHGQPVPGTASAVWFEAPGGAVLRRELASGAVVFEPALRSTMTSALVAASATTVAAAPADRTSTTRDNARVRARGENR
jgi:hypothetical protein